MDLSKAFDTLDHNILLHKLKYCGIIGPAFELFKSYLTNCKQYVELENTTNLILSILPLVCLKAQSLALYFLLFT